jgi:hypothetical protein
MRKLISIAFLFIAATSFGQITNNDVVKDSVHTVRPNKLQAERITAIQKQIAELNALMEDHIQLIIGVRKEDLEKLEVKDGAFVFTLKKPK